MTERILLIRAGAFGDMIMMTALCSLAARAESLEITVITTGGWSEPVLERSPHVVASHRPASMNKPFLLAGDKRRLAKELSQQSFDALWICGDTQPTREFAKRCVDDSVPVMDIGSCPRAIDEHDIDHLLRFAGAEAKSFRPRLRLRDFDKIDADQWLQKHGLAQRPFVLIQPGNKKTMRSGKRDRSSNIKYWPEERWAEVLLGLHQQDQTKLLCYVGRQKSAIWLQKLALIYHKTAS